MSWFTWEHVKGVLESAWTSAALVILIGWPVVRFFAGQVRKTLTKRSTPQASMLGYRFVLYGGSVILVLTALDRLEVPLSTILGAAGIASVAIGFAAQTSLSNLISGIFLIWEKPFGVEDVIKSGDTTGVVVAIDLLSTKIRTFDNMLVRIPNETLIKTQTTNITRFQIRRFDINLGVAYKEDIGKVIKILKEIADKNPNCLDEPEPLIVFKGFGDSALEFLFGVWFARADFLKLRNSIQREIKERFDAEGIEIPFPHRSLYAGEASKPFPIRLVRDKPGQTGHKEEAGPDFTD
ncbi:MAG: mechanosensitive ion channel family protein [Verrucomicrobia bacterium]|nr:mechanosensitive ion channel family protein [Verrucomicrobiota bacterium]MCH8528190.1 mechanosensitive ion channel family protein [Kiritimatiellia bacterium]